MDYIPKSICSISDRHISHLLKHVQDRSFLFHAKTRWYYATTQTKRQSLDLTMSKFRDKWVLHKERGVISLIVYTEKGLSFQRIHFDHSFWRDLVVKLKDFYDICLGPEIVSPVHLLGIKVRDLRLMWVIHNGFFVMFCEILSLSLSLFLPLSFSLFLPLSLLKVDTL